MSAKWRKFLSYYRPYLKGFIADMCFALIGPATSLIIRVTLFFLAATVMFPSVRAPSGMPVDKIYFPASFFSSGAEAPGEDTRNSFIIHGFAGL